MTTTGGSPYVPDPSETKDFIDWATSPLAWFGQASHLHASSELLWAPIARLFELQGKPSSERFDTSGLHSSAYLLVAGFAIEAMLKAAAIQAELNAGGIERVIVPGAAPTLRPWIKTHNLEKLAVRCGLTYGDEQSLHLQRFQKYVLWAGRYPVPVMPAGLNDARGFDHRLGMQDRRVFNELFDDGRRAFFTAYGAKGAWSEPTSIGHYREREAIWMSMCTDWLRVVGSTLIDHALQVCQGERGVLHVNIDTSDIINHLETPRVMVKLEPAWIPATEFVRLVGGSNGVGIETATRWATALDTMDPSADVALFLCSAPDDDGRWFSRYIFIRGGEIAPEPVVTSMAQLGKR